MSADFEAFAKEEVFLHCSFIFVVEGAENFGIFPVDVAIGAVAGMFGNARNVFIRFIRCYVIFMLTHTSFKVYTSLAYILRFRVTAACLLVNTLFFKGFGFGLVRAA